MSSHTIDINWAVDQLRRAGYGPGDRQAIGTSVRNLLEKLNSQNSPLADKLEVVGIFARLAAGQNIAPDNVQGDIAWVPFDLSLASTGDTVRVREEAYGEGTGSEHNGRVGTLVGARSGLAIVQYLGVTEGVGVRHKPDLLETQRS